MMPKTTDLSLTLAMQGMDNAAAEYEEREKGLYRPDGKPLFSHAEMQERQRVALQAVDEATQFALKTSQQALQEAQELELVADHGDDLGELTLLEMDRAVALRPFIADACDRLGMEALEQRLRAVAVTGDKPTKILYLRYATWRLETERAALARTVNRRPATLDRAGSTTEVDPDKGALVMALEKTLKALATTVESPKAQQAKIRAAELKKRSAELRDRAMTTGNRLGVEKLHQPRISDFHRKQF